MNQETMQDLAEKIITLFGKDFVKKNLYDATTIPLPFPDSEIGQLKRLIQAVNSS